MKPCMHRSFPGSLRRRLQALLALVAASAAFVAAASAEGARLAPGTAALVRVFNATAQAPLAARLGDQLIEGIAAFGATEFASLRPGSHRLTVGAVKTRVRLAATRRYTAILTDSGLRVLDHEGPADGLKSQVVVYNLVEGSQLSLRTADGTAAVVEPVAPQAFGSRELNPARVGFKLFDGAVPLVDVAPINLQRGRSFSLFVSGTRTQPRLAWVVN